MVGIVSSINKTSKQLAKDTARKIAGEPLEVLKQAGAQVVGQESVSKTSDLNTQGAAGEINSQSQSNLPNAEEVKKKDLGRIKELEEEAKRIRRDNLFNNLQARISAGEDISLENITELSWEEKQVLQAQIEAVKVRKLQQDAEATGNIVESTARPSRKLGKALKGMKAQLDKLTRKSEIRMPPSG